VHELQMFMPAETDRCTSTINVAGPRPTVQDNGRECQPIRASNSNGSHDRSDNPARMNFSGGARLRESRERVLLLLGELLLHPDQPLSRVEECAAR